MDPYKNISDKELALLLKDQANSKYFSIFTNRYQRYIYQKCLQYVKSTEDADDLAQETQIRVFMKIQEFRAEASLKTWINSIIYHICIDFLRKKSKRQTYAIITEKIADTLFEEIEELPDSMSDEGYDAMMELLDHADEQDKLILILKYKENHSLKEIQDTLGISESALKMRLSRAKSKLQALYKKKTT